MFVSPIFIYITCICRGICLLSYQVHHLFQVQTDLQQVEETKFLINIANADSINHIVIFMTGQTPFPDALGGAGEYKYLQ